MPRTDSVNTQPLAEYNKPFLSTDEQRELLARRGLRIEDPALLDSYLRHEGYYRMSPYFHAFLLAGPDGGKLDCFSPGTSFADVARLYEYDKWLRSLMLAALRSIEISVRVAIAHHLGRRDIFAHENPNTFKQSFLANESTFRGKSWHQAWLDKYRQLLTRKDTEDYIRAFMAKYGERIPIWVAIELWDFGLLSRFFSGMKNPDQQAVSMTYGVGEPGIFASWLRNFSYVRNVCAHHSRLWNRNLVEQPRLVLSNPIPELRHLCARGVKAPGSRAYATIALSAYVLKKMNHVGDWGARISALFEAFPSSPPCVLPRMMGIPENWRELALWGKGPPARPQPGQGERPAETLPPLPGAWRNP
ncbi:MAG: Abi family protein [Puniceicoccales bacterium]|jgi:abortive infection bacteriophage resistance protein|nr:Abi family protein [Puniceicoccales bacterium]